MLLKDKVVIVSGIGPGLGQELSTLAPKRAPRLWYWQRAPRPSWMWPSRRYAPWVWALRC